MLDADTQTSLNSIPSADAVASQNEDIMNQALLDRAYSLHKQGAEAHRAASLRQLANEFPATGQADIELAFDKAGKLIDAACEWAEQKRGAQNDGTGTPVVVLSKECPGFSDEVYSDAESWGLYLTK